MTETFLLVAATDKSDAWKTLAKLLETIIEEATFTGTPEALTFRAMDPSHIALLDLTWPSSAFTRYVCDKECKFTVRVQDFVKLMRRAEAKDKVELQVSEEQMLLKFANGYPREFKLHLVESVFSPTPLPKLNFNVSLALTTELLLKIVSDIETVSDHIKITTTSDKVVLSGKSDSGSATLTIDKGNPSLLELQAKEESKTIYSLDYLSKTIKPIGAPTVKCEYSNKMPLKLSFKLSDSGGDCTFYLAPRIEEQ